jgi:hypothetical protein
MLNQILPFRNHRQRNPGVTISRQIDEVKRSVNTIKIDRLRPTWRIARERQPFLLCQGVQQTGLTYVTSSQKRYFGQPVLREKIRLA